MPMKESILSEKREFHSKAFEELFSQGAFHRELGVSPDPSKKTAAFTNRPPTLTSIASQPHIVEDFSTYSLAQEALSGTDSQEPI